MSSSHSRMGCRLSSPASSVSPSNASPKKADHRPHLSQEWLLQKQNALLAASKLRELHFTEKSTFSEVETAIEAGALSWDISNIIELRVHNDPFHTNHPGRVMEELHSFMEVLSKKTDAKHETDNMRAFKQNYCLNQLLKLSASEHSQIGNHAKLLDYLKRYESTGGVVNEALLNKLPFWTKYHYLNRDIDAKPESAPVVRMQL